MQQDSLSENVVELPAVPGFESLRYLGEGGMGQVILARSAADQQTVAIKLLRTSVQSVENRERFARESRIGKDIRHPNLVSVIASGTVDGRDYQVMEYVEGAPLRDHIDADDVIELSQIRDIVDSVSDAVQYLHENRVLHRDIKPENILVGPNTVKLADMGVSVDADQIGEITITGSVVGTWDYMSPEQRTRLPVDERSDQYALAVVAYEMLCKRRPFGRFKSPSELHPTLDKRVDDVLARALEQEPDDRFRSVSEFNAAFQAATNGESSRTRWNGWIAGAAVLAFACAIGVAARSNEPTDLPPTNAASISAENGQPDVSEEASHPEIAADEPQHQGGPGFGGPPWSGPHRDARRPPHPPEGHGQFRGPRHGPRHEGPPPHHGLRHRPLPPRAPLPPHGDLPPLPDGGADDGK